MIAGTDQVVSHRDQTCDMLERLDHVAFELTRSRRLAAVLGLELGVLYYGLASWKSRAHVPVGATAFTHHRRSGHAVIVVALLMLMAVEGLAVHMLLSKWSALAAWLFTLGTTYGALWLIADFRATVLRPILIDDERIVFRAGFRCTLLVPRASIAGIGRAKPSFGNENLNLTFMGTPTRWLMLSEPMQARGLHGLRRAVRAIGVDPDAPEAFDRMLESDPSRPRR